MKFSLTFSDLTNEEVGKLLSIAGQASNLPGGAPNYAPSATMAQPAPPAYMPPAPSAAPWAPPAQPAPLPPAQGAVDPALLNATLQAMQGYAGHYKADGIKAVFTQYQLPPSLQGLNAQQLELVRKHFASLQAPGTVIP